MGRRWAGWGAGPAGAGSVGGPTWLFLALALVGCAIVSLVLWRDGNDKGALFAAAAVAYFGLRLARVLGWRRPHDEP
jgi:hypothetical protein